MMDTAIRWLRISYWAGAIIDGLAAIQMLSPAIFGTMNRLPDFHPGPDYWYAMGMGASLMIGWTVLLIWADRKPVERRGILPITVFPVITGLAASEAWAVRTGFLSLGAVIPIWVLQAVLVALFMFSYFNVSRRQSSRAG